MNKLHDHGFLRIWHILGDPNATPPIAPIIPVGRSTWWEGVRIGRFPPPVKLGPRTSAWRASEILALAKDPDAYFKQMESHRNSQLHTFGRCQDLNVNQKKDEG
jgi:prophage regulatory protein